MCWNTLHINVQWQTLRIYLYNIILGCNVSIKIKINDKKHKRMSVSQFGTSCLLPISNVRFLQFKSKKSRKSITSKFQITLMLIKRKIFKFEIAIRSHLQYFSIFKMMGMAHPIIFSLSGSIIWLFVNWFYIEKSQWWEKYM